MSGAQHGTSGNSSERLREIAAKTRTTKANVATALQMISWGLEVNDYGNARLDNDGKFIKVKGEGVTENIWSEIVACAESKALKAGDYKKLNLPFENRLLGQPKEIKERMSNRVEEFIYKMLVNVFNAQDTAPIVISSILDSGTCDPGPKTKKLEDSVEWTLEKIVKKAKSIITDKGSKGGFDD
jgi:fructose-bisphosphate aldolase class II